MVITECRRAGTSELRVRSSSIIGSRRGFQKTHDNMELFRSVRHVNFKFLSLG